MTMLASNVNLVTHYAKGTFLLIIFVRTAYKTTISISFPHGTIRYCLCIVFSL